MKGFYRNLDEKGAVLFETAISVGLLLFLIAGVSNLGTLIWEATLFTEANRSASRFSTMQFLGKQACGSSAQVYSDFIEDEVFNYLAFYQQKNLSSGRNSWKINPQVNLRRVSWPRGSGTSHVYAESGWEDTGEGEGYVTPSGDDNEDTESETQSQRIAFDYSVVTISNIPDQSCKFCSSIFQNLFNIRTTSVFMLPCNLELNPNQGDGKDTDKDEDTGKDGGESHDKFLS